MSWRPQGNDGTDATPPWPWVEARKEKPQDQFRSRVARDMGGIDWAWVSRGGSASGQRASRYLTSAFLRKQTNGQESRHESAFSSRPRAERTEAEESRLSACVPQLKWTERVRKERPAKSRPRHELEGDEHDLEKRLVAAAFVLQERKRRGKW